MPRRRRFTSTWSGRAMSRPVQRSSACLVNPAFQERFRRLTWEGIYRFFSGNPALETMRRYLETKTAGLVRAFNLRNDKPMSAE